MKTSKAINKLYFKLYKQIANGLTKHNKDLIQPIAHIWSTVV